MTDKARTARVLVGLVASMTIGGLALMALDSQKPAGGAYSLASYLRLDPIEKATLSPITTKPAQWSSIEVFYSHTKGGDAKQLLSDGVGGFHFVVCNGKGAVADGQIQVTESWANQRYFQTAGKTIRVCVIADRKDQPATGSQLKRTATLVDSLCRNFKLTPAKVAYPADWQM